MGIKYIINNNDNTITNQFVNGGLSATTLSSTTLNLTFGSLLIVGQGTGDTTNSLIIQNSGGTDNFIIKDDGRVFLKNDFEIGYGPIPIYETNAVFGKNALKNFSRLDGAGYNVAIGLNALKDTNVGIFNTAINNSLIKNTTGVHNTAIGYRNLNESVTNNYNLAVGTENLVNLTTGSFNTALSPYASLFRTTNGQYNTTLGAYAGVYIDTGSYNTILGSYSLSGNELSANTMSYNTVVGNNNLTTLINGNSNTVIGRSVESLSESMSNHILIGDGSGNIRIMSDNLGNIGIGTTSPSEKLEVSGKTKTINLQVTSGATAGYILTSDSNGNATWELPPLSLTDLGFTITPITPPTINQNIFLPENSNVTYPSPLTIGSGFTITIPSGTTLTIS